MVGIGIKDLTIPGTGALEMELNRVRYQREYMKVIRSTVYSLITVAAVQSLLLPMDAGTTDLRIFHDTYPRMEGVVSVKVRALSKEKS